MKYSMFALAVVLVMLLSGCATAHIETQASDYTMMLASGLIAVAAGTFGLLICSTRWLCGYRNGSWSR